MKQQDREALRIWEDYKQDSLRKGVVIVNKSRAEIERHKALLEKRPLEWIRFFFPEFCKFDFAPFQIKAIMRCIEHDEWFEVLSWARSLAKSTCVMFIVMFLVLTGRKRNVIMA